jgi:hypothetical protein
MRPASPLKISGSPVIPFRMPLNRRGVFISSPVGKAPRPVGGSPAAPMHRPAATARKRAAAAPVRGAPPTKTLSAAVPAKAGRLAASLVRNAQGIWPNRRARPDAPSSPKPGTGFGLGSRPVVRTKKLWSPVVGYSSPTAAPGQRRAGARHPRSFDFHMSRHAQTAILHLPHVQDYLEARERLLKVEVAERLMVGGLSLNRSARILGWVPSRLHHYRSLYRAGGFDALFPRRHLCGARKRSGGPRSPAPCRLTFFLR